jgi:arginyl-tRNA synthetase
MTIWLKIWMMAEKLLILMRKIVTIVKSDGTSLYVTRDIAAALDRREKFGLLKLIYVVDNAQGHHFQNLSGSWAGWLCQVREDSGH